MLNTRVDQLVFAMASLAEPHFSKLRFPMDYQEEFHPVITRIREAV